LLGNCWETNTAKLALLDIFDAPAFLFVDRCQALLPLSLGSRFALRLLGLRLNVEVITVGPRNVARQPTCVIPEGSGDGQRVL
jgi:hypothetical protein